MAKIPKPLKPTEAEAAKLLLEELTSPVQKAKRRLLDFVLYTMPTYKVDTMHRVIADKLDQVSRGNIKRLMIFAPPQSGKSQLASIHFPAYYLSKHPDDPMILASYGAELAESKSRQVRGLIQSVEYKDLFPDVTLSKHSKAVARWQLGGVYKGGMLACGAGGPLTGNPAMLGIIDDPVSSWAAAQSAHNRNLVWDWYRGTFLTRLWENAALVLIMTRWHENDLAGRILNTSGGREWEIIRIPAICEDEGTRAANCRFMGISYSEDPLARQPGEPATPSRFSIGELIKIRDEIGTTAWAAEYQQVPRPLEGARFKREFFEKFVQNAPNDGKRIRYWDKAGTEDTGEAATAGVLICMGKDGLIYIEDVVQGWWTAHEREQKILNTAARDSALYGGPYVVKIWVEQEPGSGGKESAESTVQNLLGYSVYLDKVQTNKDARLEPFAAQAEAGRIRVVKGHWNSSYIEELVSVPNGIRRDQADATGGAFSKLIKGGNAILRMDYDGLWGKNERSYGGWKR
jgi:predicted phage terminase large subunit-like protein